MCMKQTKKRKKKLLGIAVGILAVLLAAGDGVLSVTIYRQNFNKRFERQEPLLQVTDFEGLQCTKYSFPSDKGQMLQGYGYTVGTDWRGILVMAHGFGGGGQSGYMDCADYFARHGYYVFAYDATGNDESEGEGVGGLPQGVIDLDHAISFVEESGQFPDLPIVLFGHSWGAYSVCNVLTYHPEVKGVIACSGFNRSSDMLEAEGKNQVGNAIYLMMPFVKLYEQIKFGGYAANTALDGFAASDAAVMIVHSADDKKVPIQYGYDVYYEKYRDDPRFTFVRLEHNGHDYVYQDTTYIKAFNEGFDNWLETLPYEYQAEENQERFLADRTAYIHSHLDRYQWSHTLNTELFQQFADFYDAQLRTDFME